MNEKELLKEIKDLSFENYKKMKSLEGKKLKFYHVIKESIFEYNFLKLEKYLKVWIRSLKNQIEIDNLKKMPDYAFIHFIGKNNNTCYADEVGLINVNLEDLKSFNMTLEEYMEQESCDFNFDNYYGELIADIFSIEIDKELSKHVDRTNMIHIYSTEPIEKHYKLSEIIQGDIISEMAHTQQMLFCAIGRSTLELTTKRIGKI